MEYGIQTQTTEIFPKHMIKVILNTIYVTSYLTKLTTLQEILTLYCTTQIYILLLPFEF